MGARRVFLCSIELIANTSCLFGFYGRLHVIDNRTLDRIVNRVPGYAVTTLLAAFGDWGLSYPNDEYASHCRSDLGAMIDM